jgi:uncharacterized protein
MLLDEPEMSAIMRALDTFDRRTASRLLDVELHRLGLREGLLEHIDGLLATIVLIPLDEETLIAAKTVTPSKVATLDAIHLATAVRLADQGELDALMTYDKQLAFGAREHGITVLSPTDAYSRAH